MAPNNRNPESYTYIYAYIHMYLSVCVYMYICIYVYMHKGTFKDPSCRRGPTCDRGRHGQKGFPAELGHLWPGARDPDAARQPKGGVSRGLQGLFFQKVSGKGLEGMPTSMPIVLTGTREFATLAARGPGQKNVRSGDKMLVVTTMTTSLMMELGCIRATSAFYLHLYLLSLCPSVISISFLFSRSLRYMFFHLKSRILNLESLVSHLSSLISHLFCLTSDSEFLSLSLSLSQSFF